MILVSNEVGSKELETPLRALGLPVEKCHLDAGDVAFSGRGEKGAPLWIGIELKKLPDLISSLTSERLQGHQIPAMIQDEKFDRRYMIVEGDFAHDATGRMVKWAPKQKRLAPVHGGGNAIDFEQALLGLQVRTGLITRHVATRRDTIRVIHAWYRWWTDQDLDKHKRHLAVYAPDLDRNLLIPVTLKRQLAAQLPGIGYERSRAVDKHFPSIRAMFMADAAEWAQIEGIGMKTATKVVDAVVEKEKR